MKYGRYLRDNMHPSWASHYIDYGMLKKVVMTTALVQGADPALIPVGVRDAAINEDVRSFMSQLDVEVERVTLFYTQTAAELRVQLALLNAEQQAVGASEALVEALRAVGRTAVLLVQFLELNLTGLRKILKKHEKRITGFPVAARFLESRRSNESALQRLHNHTELDEIYDAVREAINVAHTDLQLHELANSSSEKTSEKTSPEHNERSDDDGEPERGYAARAPARLDSGTSSTARVRALESGGEGSAPPLLRRESSLFTHEPILREMAERLKQLDNASRFVNTLIVSLAATSGITAEEGQGMHKSDSKVALALNLLSTFIFMVNYYVVLPSSGAYCAALGQGAHFSGVVVGILPAAACLAAVAYSYATQYSYRLPLLVSAALCTVGNVLYGLALPANSIKLLLLGRVLVGMGGARVVNRRYIADHVDLEYRTEASAAFVASTALGMAVGPGIAAAIASLPPFQLLGLPANGLTLPGYGMVLLWMPFFAAVLFFFNEPPLAAHGFAQPLSTSKSAKAKRRQAVGQAAGASAPLLPVAECNSLSSAQSPPGGIGSRRTSETGAGNTPSTGGRHLKPHTPASRSAGKSQSVFGNPETRPLLTLEESGGGGNSRAQLMPVFALLWLYLADKLVAEAWLTSVPIVTGAMFGWGERETGAFLCCVCALVLPASQLCSLAYARVATHARESTMAWALLFGGVLLLCLAPPFTSTPRFTYIAGATIFFLANNMLECAILNK